MEMNEMIRLIWDFYGPDAEQTAIHHAKHLKEYAVLHQLQEADTGVSHEQNGVTAWIDVLRKDMISVRDTLKPKRGELVKK